MFQLTETRKQITHKHDRKYVIYAYATPITAMQGPISLT